MSTTEHLTLSDGAAAVDAKFYRQVIGSLMYFTFTRPDICFSVNKLAQFQLRQPVKHWQATKCLLCCLKKTLTHGLHYQPSTSHMMVAYF